MDRAHTTSSLLGAGLYAPNEVARFTGIPASKISRWFMGHVATGKQYESLWTPSLKTEDGRLYLSFRDLTEVRVADAFIKRGLSPQKIRRAIQLAQIELGDSRPLSSARFKTDGRTIFLQIANEEGDGERDYLLDLFKSQLAFKRIIEPSLKGVDFTDSAPSKWWIAGRDRHILLDPTRSFGRPIEEDSCVPTAILANAFRAEGSISSAARAYEVPTSSVRRAVEFEKRFAT